MAEAKKTTVEKPAETTAPPKLAPAAASGDPSVQFLLATRSTHTSNGDVEKVAEVDEQLAVLGFTAQ